VLVESRILWLVGKAMRVTGIEDGAGLSIVCQTWDIEV
jgi:hypothetical protein